MDQSQGVGGGGGTLMRPSQGLWGTGGKRAFISVEQRPNFEGNRGTKKKYLGTGNIRKQIFDFLGTGEQANLFQGNKGTGTPLGGPL